MKLIRTAVAMLIAVVMAILVEPLTAGFRAAMRVCAAKVPPLPRVLRLNQHFQAVKSYAKVVAGGRGFAVATAVLALALTVGAVLVGAIEHAATGALLAFPAVATTKDLPKILAELKALQEKYAGKAMPEDEAKKFSELANEAKAIQDEADREKQIKEFERFAETVPNPTLPKPSADTKGDPNNVVAYISLGEAFVRSDEYKNLRKMGFPHGSIIPVQFEGASHMGGQNFKGGVVAITRKMIEERKELKELIERKAVPTIGANVIRPDRQAEIVRATEHDRLVLRDILNVSQTDSNAVDYVTISSVTRAAAPTAESAAKPEAAMALASATAPVRTIAVWMPATEQQLMDVPQLQNMIDVELRYDLAKVEEEQIMWGSGTGENLLGIMNTPGVTAGRTEAGDTLIDMIKRCATDVRLAGLEPNGVAIHPLDWETIVLTKGTDERYIWVVVTDEAGLRLWGLRVVETVAMREPGAFTTPARRLLVGDFLRGATLWDRMQAQVQLGWINDQFIKNQRTIRAEERVAFGVKRPAGFKFRETQARVA